MRAKGTAINLIFMWEKGKTCNMAHTMGPLSICGTPVPTVTWPQCAEISISCCQVQWDAKEIVWNPAATAPSSVYALPDSSLPHQSMLWFRNLVFWKIFPVYETCTAFVLWTMHFPWVQARLCLAGHRKDGLLSRPKEPSKRQALLWFLLEGFELSLPQILISIKGVKGGSRKGLLEKQQGPLSETPNNPKGILLKKSLNDLSDEEACPDFWLSATGLSAQDLDFEFGSSHAYLSSALLTTFSGSCGVQCWNVFSITVGMKGNIHTYFFAILYLLFWFHNIFLL